MDPEDLKLTAPIRYSKSEVTTFLDQFSRNNPQTNIFAAPQSIAEADVISVCIKYFLSPGRGYCKLTYFLQIVMLIQYIENHAVTYDYRDQIKLYKLLDSYQYSFEDFLYLFQNTNTLRQVFYTDAITVTQECLTFLAKQSKKLHKSWILFLLNNSLSSNADIFGKSAISTPPPDLDQKISMLHRKQKRYIYAVIDMHKYHKRFNNAMCSTMHIALERISNDEYSNMEISLNLIKFIIACPYFKSASHEKFNTSNNIEPNKQKQLWGYIAKLINKAGNIVLKEQVLDYVYAFLFVNPKTKLATKLQLLNFLNRNLSITDKTYITTKLTQQRFALPVAMLQAIFDFNFGLHGKNHFNSQCNAFLRNYLRYYMEFRDICISESTLNNMWRHYAISNRGLLKLLSCTNFDDPELDLSEYTVQEIYQWLQTLQKFENSQIEYIKYNHANKFELNPSATERILRTTCAMLQTHWLATNEVLRFKVTSQVKIDDILVDIGEAYWSLTFKDNKYCWYNPKQFQGEIWFDWYQISQVAINFYNTLKADRATHLMLHQYQISEPRVEALTISPIRITVPTPYAPINNNRTEPRLERNSMTRKLR